jgi:hypothetical protein
MTTAVGGAGEVFEWGLLIVGVIVLAHRAATSLRRRG